MDDLITFYVENYEVIFLVKIGRIGLSTTLIKP